MRGRRFDPERLARDKLAQLPAGFITLAFL